MHSGRFAIPIAWIPYLKYPEIETGPVIKGFKLWSIWLSLCLLSRRLYIVSLKTDWDPRERLETILQFPSLGKSEQIAQTYLPVLTQLSARLKTSHDKDKLYQEFRMIVGSVVSLAKPLSKQALAVLLNTSPDTIAFRLRPLHSVLRIPSESSIPIRTLHLSFNEFLLSDQIQLEPFGVNGQATHRMLLSKCLQLLSGPEGLQENLCKLEYPGKLRREIDQSTINDRLSPAFQYACRY